MQSRELSLDRDVCEFRQLFSLFASEQKIKDDKIEMNIIIENIKNIEKIDLPEDTLVYYMKTLVRMSMDLENVYLMINRPWPDYYGFCWLTCTDMYTRPDNGLLCSLTWALIRNISRFAQMRDWIFNGNIVYKIIGFMQDESLVVDHLPHIQWCKILEILSDGYKYSKYISSRGGIQALLRIMPKYIHAIELQKVGCLVLYNLCHRLADDSVSQIEDVGRVREIVANNGIAIVEDAGKTFVCGCIIRNPVINYVRETHYKLLRILRDRRDSDILAGIWE